MSFHNPTLCFPYQAGVAVVVSQLPGYVPVSVLLDGGHVGELDGAAEVTKLQLQTGRFLCVFTMPWKNHHVSPGAYWWSTNGGHGQGRMQTEWHSSPISEHLGSGVASYRGLRCALYVDTETTDSLSETLSVTLRGHPIFFNCPSRQRRRTETVSAAIGPLTKSFLE